MPGISMTEISGQVPRHWVNHVWLPPLELGPLTRVNRRTVELSFSTLTGLTIWGKGPTPRKCSMVKTWHGQA